VNDLTPSAAPQVATPASPAEPHRPPSDRAFLASFWILGGTYVLLLAATVAADAFYTTPGHLWRALGSPEIRHAIRLSLLSCTLTTLLSLWVAVPIGYLLTRVRFRGQALVDALLDIPIVLPPLVIGLSLLILFQAPPLRALERYFPVTYAVPSIILAQFMVAAAFAVRTLRATFDQLSPRTEQVALTLGCNRSQAFWMVVFPAARRGLVTAATLAWARSLGEFGPILIFSGATRMKTEVLPTTVYLELSVGNLEAAVAVSLLMVVAAVAVLLLIRGYGLPAATHAPHSRPPLNPR
jgi:molybdate transport system permease protein